MNISVLDIGIAKNIFQLHGVDGVLWKNLSCTERIDKSHLDPQQIAAEVYKADSYTSNGEKIDLYMERANPPPFLTPSLNQPSGLMNKSEKDEESSSYHM